MTEPMTPERLDTSDYREAVAGEGPLAYTWSDKPHRLVYDLAAEVDRLQAENKRAMECFDRDQKVIADLQAERARLRAQVTAVKACLPRWESEVDEQTRVKEFGIAEGVRVALQDVRQAFGAGDGYCICDSISRPERDCGVAEHRRAALASGEQVQP